MDPAEFKTLHQRGFLAKLIKKRLGTKTIEEQKFTPVELGNGYLYDRTFKLSDFNGATYQLKLRVRQPVAGECIKHVVELSTVEVGEWI